MRLSLSAFLCIALNTAAAAQEPAGPSQTNPAPAQPPVQLITDETLQPRAPETLPQATPAPISPAIAALHPAGPPAPPADGLFPRYEGLKPAIAFWTRVFRDYSENQSVIHSSDHVSKVYDVLDFRDEAARMSAVELARYRSKAEKQAKLRVESLLRQVHAKRHDPASLTSAERELYELFRDIEGDKKFLHAAGDIRSQRGLKERTELALEVSQQYLPAMERTFAAYGLPKQLTRLPLVESSFNIEAYSKVGAAGLWQFIPSSARIYMRLDEVVDDRRDPWTSTDAAARHLRDDYAELGSWPLALTAYNHGRAGIARGLRQTGGKNLMDLIERYDHRRFGFASRNFYAEFLAASDVEREYRRTKAAQKKDVIAFDVVETKHYVPYETLRRLCGADDSAFRKLNPAYRPEVIEGKLYVPPGHLIRVPAGAAKAFEVSYAQLGDHEVFSAQKVYFLLHKVKRGDTLGKLAKRHGVSQAAIRSANAMKKGSTLRVGQVLKIPPRAEKRPGPVTVAIGESKPALTREQKRAEQGARYVVHKVRSGQTLSAIARRYQVSLAALREANDLGSSSHIRAGMKLKVPTNS